MTSPFIFGAWPPDNKLWQLHKTAASIDLARQIEELTTREDLGTDSYIHALRIILENIKCGHLVATAFMPAFEGDD